MAQTITSTAISLLSSAEPATTSIYTLSLHDALPICMATARPVAEITHHRRSIRAAEPGASPGSAARLDRESTRLNSSHVELSYAVSCLEKQWRWRRWMLRRQLRLRPRTVRSRRHNAD